MAGCIRLPIGATHSCFVFSSVFNFLPFHLARPPLSIPVQWITALYLTYVLGILVGPIAGGISNRVGNGPVLAGGAVLFGFGVSLTLVPSAAVVALALAAVCAGYFAVHASAVGALNQRLQSGPGRANALYVLFYYVGGWSGITASGFAYERHGWVGVVALCLVALILPALVGLREHISGLSD